MSPLDDDTPRITRPGLGSALAAPTATPPLRRTLGSPASDTSGGTPPIAARPTPQVTRALPDSAAGAAGDLQQPKTEAPTPWRPQRTLGVGNASIAGAMDGPEQLRRPQPLPQAQAIAAPPVRRLQDTFKPTLNSGTGAHGEPVYDQASVDRMAARPQINRTLAPPTQPIATRPEPGFQRTLITRPQPSVASTFGQSAMSMPDDDNQAGIQRPQSAFRGPDAMAEQYNSREARDARQKVLSDLDSQRFRLEMIASNPGRRGRAALEALGQNAQQQAALVAGGEKLGADAIQGRAGRDAGLANTGLEQAGQDRRTQLDADNRLGIASMNDATNRAQIAAGQDKGETFTAADGRVFRINGNSAALVTDTDGQPVRAAQPRDPTALTQAQVLDSLGTQLKAATDQLTAMSGVNGTSTPEQVQQQQAYVQRLQGELASARAGSQGVGGGGSNGQQQRTKPSWEDYQRRAKAQGSRMTPEQLKAHYDSMN